MVKKNVLQVAEKVCVSVWKKRYVEIEKENINMEISFVCISAYRVDSFVAALWHQIIQHVVMSMVTLWVSWAVLNLLF